MGDTGPVVTPLNSDTLSDKLKLVIHYNIICRERCHPYSCYLEIFLNFNSCHFKFCT